MGVIRMILLYPTGKQLFNDPQFAGSINASSCSGCHPGGKGLGNAGSNPQLFSVINTCITGLPGGQAIAEDSEEMLSLKGYIESLGGNEKTLSLYAVA